VNLSSENISFMYHNLGKRLVVPGALQGIASNTVRRRCLASAGNSSDVQIRARVGFVNIQRELVDSVFQSRQRSMR